MKQNLQTISKATWPAQDGTTLSVVGEPWLTIQGEGPLAGFPAVFIRLAGCNLTCPKCFGVAVKGRIPFLTKVKGKKIRLDKVRVGEEVFTFNQNMEIVRTKVKAVIYSTVTEWLQIRIDGKEYDVTPEHPFFTTRGLVSAAELQAGDVVLEAKSSEVVSVKKLGKNNPMKDKEVARRSAENTDYKAAGKKISETIAKKKEEGTYIPTFHRLDPEQQEEVRRKQSEGRRREKNPNWTGKEANLLDLREKIEKGEVTECAACGERKRLLIHHLDDNHSNDEASNLVAWCHRCHNQHHQRGYNFWNGDRKDGKELVQKHNGQTVEKVQRCQGSLPVVNISCGPFNSYFANRMWVHNCDTDYTNNAQERPIEWIVEWVNSIVEQTPIRLVVITGGEPFRQGLTPLCRLLIEAGFTIQIETNGTLLSSTMEGVLASYLDRIFVVCSPKTPKIETELIPYIHSFKYVLSHGKVDPKDGLPTEVLGYRHAPARPEPGLPVFVQPADEQDEAANRRNMQAAITSSLKYGYRMGLQLHKILGVP